MSQGSRRVVASMVEHGDHMSEAGSGSAPQGRGSQLQSVLGFALEVFRVPGGDAAKALGLLLVAGLVEGVSLLLLVPLLSIAMSANSLAIHKPAWVNWLGLDQSFLTVGTVLIVFVMASALQVALSYAKDVRVSRTLNDYVRFKQVALFTSLSEANWGHASQLSASAMSRMLTAEVERLGEAGHNLLSFLQSLFMLGLYVALSALISPSMTIFATILGMISFLVLAPVRTRSIAFGQFLVARYHDQHHTIATFMAGLKLAKSMGVERRYAGRFEASTAYLADETAKYVTMSGAMDGLVKVGNAVALCAFLYFAIEYQNMDLPSLVVMILIFMRISPRFSGLQSNVQHVLTNLPVLAALNAVKADADRAAEALVEAHGAPLSLRQTLQIEAVSFRYPQTESNQALQNISFTIPAGQITALIGPSGSGKSTMADLLMGLTSPDCGKILVDKTPLTATNRRHWRQQVAYVQQEVFLFAQSLRENMQLARFDATDAQIWACLEMASAATFVRQLPAQLDTVVGSTGVRLSVGEQQRIALARALLREPELLVLDEATSALDWENQKLVADAVENLRGKVTILTIAHRPSMIAFADQVVTFSHGKVVEVGSFDVLKADPNSHLSLMIAGESVG